MKTCRDVNYDHLPFIISSYYLNSRLFVVMNYWLYTCDHELAYLPPHDYEYVSPVKVFTAIMFTSMYCTMNYNLRDLYICLQ